MRMTSKTMEKDTKEKMAANMKMMDNLMETMEEQVMAVPGVDKVTIKHKGRHPEPNRLFFFNNVQTLSVMLYTCTAF